MRDILSLNSPSKREEVTFSISLSKSGTERSRWLKSSHSYWLHKKKESKSYWEHWEPYCLGPIGSWMKMRSTCFLWGCWIVFYMKIYYSNHRGHLNFNGPFLPSYSIKLAESKILADCRLKVSTQPQQTGSSIPGYTVCQTMSMLRLEWNPHLEGTVTQQNVSTLDE